MDVGPYAPSCIACGASKLPPGACFCCSCGWPTNANAEVTSAVAEEARAAKTKAAGATGCHASGCSACDSSVTVTDSSIGPRASAGEQWAALSVRVRATALYRKTRTSDEAVVTALQEYADLMRRGRAQPRFPPTAAEASAVGKIGQELLRSHTTSPGSSPPRSPSSHCSSSTSIAPFSPRRPLADRDASAKHSPRHALRSAPRSARAHPHDSVGSAAGEGQGEGEAAARVGSEQLVHVMPDGTLAVTPPRPSSHSYHPCYNQGGRAAGEERRHPEVEVDGSTLSMPPRAVSRPPHAVSRPRRFSSQSARASTAPPRTPTPTPTLILNPHPHPKPSPSP